MVSFLTLATLALAGFNIVAAQTALPDVTEFPAACTSSCASTIEVAVLCQKEFTSPNPNSTDVAACFCNAIPTSTDLSSCQTCLSSNGAADFAKGVAAAGTACQAALKTCAFECDITLCGAKDIACQCSKSYLQDIYQCAACNTKYKNTGVTRLSDYQALNNSCVAQNYTVVPTGTTALPSPTGQAGYVAPTLSAAKSSGAASSTGPVAQASAVPSASSGSNATVAIPSASATGARSSATSTISSYSGFKALVLCGVTVLGGMVALL